MVLVNARAHYKQVKIARCDIGSRSVERSRDVENETVPEKIQG
jgi:hypothetical protein